MSDHDLINLTQQRVDHVFTDPSLVLRALRHFLPGGHPAQQQRATGVPRRQRAGAGDLRAPLHAYPDFLEGELTKIKSNIVSRKTCADLAVELRLVDLLQLGKGMGSREEVPLSLAAAVFESLIGAIYLDAGLGAARRFILRHVGGLIESAERLGHQENFKSVLQQALQKFGIDNPIYPVLAEDGPDHDKCFQVGVQIGGRRFASCWGKSRSRPSRTPRSRRSRNSGWPRPRTTTRWCCSSSRNWIRSRSPRASRPASWSTPPPEPRPPGQASSHPIATRTRPAPPHQPREPKCRRPQPRVIHPCGRGSPGAGGPPRPVNGPGTGSPRRARSWIWAMSREASNRRIPIRSARSMIRAGRPG